MPDAVRENFLFLGWSTEPDAEQDKEEDKKPDVIWQEKELIGEEDVLIKITSYTGEPTEVVIPSQINGIPVTTIGYLAFQYCDSLKSVIISNGITTIEREAFYNCYNVTNIEIPESATSIDYGVFYECQKLEQL